MKSSREVTLSRQGNLKSSHDFVGVLEGVNHSLSGDVRPCDKIRRQKTPMHTLQAEMW